jgi:hypothetical protein
MQDNGIPQRASPELLKVFESEKKQPPGVLAHYQYKTGLKDRSGRRGEFTLTNAPLKDGSLYLNGEYTALQGGKIREGSKGYVARFRTPELNYEAFTVAVRFKAETFDLRKSHLLGGGPYYRWFNLGRSGAGKLQVTFNNQRFSRQIDGTHIKAGEWTVVVCGVDVNARKVVVHFNGKQADEFELPEGFALTPPRVDVEDREWTFTNYSSGTVFHGLIDEFIVYDRLLSREELKRVPLAP